MTYMNITNSTNNLNIRIQMSVPADYKIVVTDISKKQYKRRNGMMPSEEHFF